MNRWYFDIQLKVPVYVFNISQVSEEGKIEWVKARVPVPGYRGRVHWEMMPIRVSTLAEIQVGPKVDPT